MSSQADMRQFDRLLKGMLPFHNGFRRDYGIVRNALSDTSVAQSMPKPQLEKLLQVALGLSQHLEAHHMIEERYIFPILAPKLPQFGSEHLKEHASMHAAIERFQAYAESASRSLRSSRSKPMSTDAVEAGKSSSAEWPRKVFDAYRFSKLTDELGSHLLSHLEHEEKSLRAESLIEAGFTIQELNRVPM